MKKRKYGRRLVLFLSLVLLFCTAEVPVLAKGNSETKVLVKVPESQSTDDSDAVADKSRPEVESEPETESKSESESESESETEGKSESEGESESETEDKSESEGESESETESKLESETKPEAEDTAADENEMQKSTLASSPMLMSMPATPQADGEIWEFPEGAAPTAAAYKMDAEGNRGEAISPETLLSLGDGFLLGFVWPQDQSLDALGIEAGVNYRLCQVPSQIVIAGAAEGIPIYAGGQTQPFARIYEGAAVDGMRDLWINFDMAEGLFAVSAYAGCTLADDGENAPKDGIIRISLPGGKELSFVVSDFLPKGPKLAKAAGSLTDQGTVTWTVTYTAPEDGYVDHPYISEKVPSPVKLLDQLPGEMAYVSGSAAENGGAIPEERLLYDEAANSLTYILPENAGSGQVITLTYETQLTDGAVYQLWSDLSERTLVNTVEGVTGDGLAIGDLRAEADVYVSPRWISEHEAIDKTGKYQFTNGKYMASWEITVNTVSREFDYLKVEDTLGKGLMLDETSLRVNGTALTAGDYLVTENPDGTTQIEFDLYRDGDAVVTPDAKGRYTITYSTQISEDYFYQTPGSDGQMLIGEEDVKNDARLSWKWKHAPGIGPGEPPAEPTIEKGPVKPENLINNMLQKTGRKYFTEDHILLWEVVVNPNAVHIVSAKLEDRLPNDGIVTKDGVSYKLTLTNLDEIKAAIQTQCPQAELDTFTEIKSKDDTRTIGFSCEITDLGTKQLKFSVKAEMDAAFWTANQENLPVPNEAVLSEVRVRNNNGTETTLDNAFFVSAEIGASNNLLEKEVISYDPVRKEMAWKLTLNSSAVKGLEGVTLQDVLPAGMTYISDSLRFYGTSTVNNLETEITSTSSGQMVTWKVPGGLLQYGDDAHRSASLTYKTSVDVNSDVSEVSFRTNEEIAFTNKVSLTANVEGAATTEVTCDTAIANPMLSKTHANAVGNKLTYTAALNPHGVRLLPSGGGTLYLKDRMPAGLVVDLESIRLYKANVTSAGSDSYEPVMTPGEEVQLADGDVVYAVEGTKNTFRVRVEDETPYILTYDAYVTQSNVEMKNELALVGSVLPEGSGIGSEDNSYIWKAYGDAQIHLPKSNWAIQITNVDSQKNPITFTDPTKTAAKFGLHTSQNAGDKLLEITCDLNTGIATFSQPKVVLDGVTELYLKELNPPEGYYPNDGWVAISPDQLQTLLAGGKVELEHCSSLPGKLVVDVTYHEVPPAGDTPVEFTLYEDAECTKEIGKGISTDDGKTFTFDRLDVSKTYYLKQTGAPDGYFVEPTVHAVKPDEGDGAKVSVSVTQTVPYAVVHVKQEGDGSYSEAQRDFMDPVKLGETVTVTPKNFDGYTINLEKSQLSGQVLAPDAGGNVFELKLYYDLNVDLAVEKIADITADRHADPDREFSFTLTLDGTSVDGGTADKINGLHGDMTFDQGVASFTLKVGETKLVKGLPPGMTYKVVENDADKYGYQTTSEMDEGTVALPGAVIKFTNTKTEQTGKLTVHMDITGNMADPDQIFEFTVILNDTTINGKYGNLKFKDGIATFTLKGGEKKTALELPVGTAYTVTQTEVEGYVMTMSGDSGKLSRDGDKAVFTNTKEVQLPPESETPEPETPESETPGPETPEPETPEPETPEPETPEPETPEPENPEPETPEPEPPEPETPESENPESETPESETPESETPESETPESETPESETPGSETPESETPESETLDETDETSDSIMPKTGDQSHLGLWIILMVCSGIGAVLMLNALMTRKKEKWH